MVFDSASLAQAFDRIRSRAFKTKSIEACKATVAGRRDLHKSLTSVDLVFLGIGGIIGAGVFVLTVVLSYILASIAAILSGLCYTEFAVDMPVAGGAFVYVDAILGEFLGWIAATSLLLEYTLGTAAVARAVTSYSGALLAGDAAALRLPLSSGAEGGRAVLQLDLPALAAIVALAGVLAAGTRGSAALNTAVNIANLLVILFVLATGLPYFQLTNFVPLMPMGMRGAVAGASKVFFSFLGFECVATAAEETVDPAASLPAGIIGSLLICAAIYAAMCATIVGMVPWQEIDVDTPFATAYASIGMPWAGRVVSVGALLGIVTCLLVSLFGQGSVDERTQTPLVATALAVATSGAAALLVDLEALADLVSVGILSCFLLVAVAVLWRRYAGAPGDDSSGWELAGNLTAVVVAAAAASAAYVARAPAWAPVLFLGLWAVAVWALWRRRVAWRAARFRVPWSPLAPAAAILADVFLIVSLGPAAHAAFALWTLAAAAVYVLYGVHAAADGGEGGGGDSERGLAGLPHSPGKQRRRGR